MSAIKEIRHSKKVMASFGCGNFIIDFLGLVQSVTIYFFYEVELGLESWMCALGFALWAVWDSLNDPLVGYFVDRPFRFTRKWGRRFPWLVISFIPMMFSFLLIYTPPNVSAQENPWIIFGWLLFSTCLFDTIESIFMVNLYAFYPDKFRIRSERATASTIGTYVGFCGVIVGFLMPPLVIVYGELGSYALMAWICVIISIVIWVLMLPSIRDHKETVEIYLAKYGEMERESFFKSLFQAVKHKNFVAFLLFYLLYLCLNSMMLGSFFYYVKFTLQESANVNTPLMMAFFTGTLITIPIWYKYAHKTGDHRKTLIFSTILMSIFSITLTFMTQLTGAMVVSFLFGTGLGGLMIMINPTLADVVDESVAITGKRREGLYGGFMLFISNFARVVQSITFATVHILTGFEEGADTQSDLAILGIQLHLGLIPAIFMIIGILIFWKFYDITPDKAVIIKERLLELNI